jgi:hypothetical protein
MYEKRCRFLAEKLAERHEINLLKNTVATWVVARHESKAEREKNVRKQLEVLGICLHAWKAVVRDWRGARYRKEDFIARMDDEDKKQLARTFKAMLEYTHERRRIRSILECKEQTRINRTYKAFMTALIRNSAEARKYSVGQVMNQNTQLIVLDAVYRKVT